MSDLRIDAWDRYQIPETRLPTLGVDYVSALRHAFEAGWCARSTGFAELMEAAQELHARFKPIRDDLIFSKRMALDHLAEKLSACRSPAKEST